MKIICKICNNIIEDNYHFHKLHKISQKDYFHKYEPKKDLFDGSSIEFKGNYESYIQADFNSRLNLREYLKKISLLF